MQKNRFRILAVVWLGLLVGFVFLFPYILVGLTGLIVGSGSSGGAGGAVASLLGMTIKPLGILIISIGIGWICHKRLRGLQMGRRWTLAIFFWLWSAMAFLVAIGNFWGANFGMGLLYLKPPTLLLFLTVFMVFLAFKCIDTKTTVDQQSRLAWVIAGITTVHAIFLSMFSVQEAMLLLPLLEGHASSILYPIFNALNVVNPIIAFGFPAMKVVYVDLAVFAMALAFILFREGTTRGELITVDRRSQGRRRDDMGGFVADEFKVREHHRVLEPQCTPKPVNDMVFWPMVAVCVTLVSFVAIQFVTQNQSTASAPVIVYIDANGQPMSAEQIRKIENAK